MTRRDDLNAALRVMYARAGLPVPAHLDGATEGERQQAERDLPRNDRQEQELQKN